MIIVIPGHFVFGTVSWAPFENSDQHHFMVRPDGDHENHLRCFDNRGTYLVPTINGLTAHRINLEDESTELPEHGDRVVVFLRGKPNTAEGLGVMGWCWAQDMLVNGWALDAGVRYEYTSRNGGPSGSGTLYEIVSQHPKGEEISDQLKRYAWFKVDLCGTTTPCPDPRPDHDPFDRKSSATTLELQAA